MGSSKVKKDRAGLAVVGSEASREPLTPQVPVDGDSPSGQVPDSEVSERPTRRRFTAAYKLRILEDADRCRDSQGIGSLLRREGLYSSHLTTWRRQRQEGSLSALAPRKRGRRAVQPHPDTQRVAQLEREKRRLERRLKQAEALLELQKKVSEILGIALPPTPIDEGE
jgi:transposase